MLYISHKKGEAYKQSKLYAHTGLYIVIKGNWDKEKEITEMRDARHGF